MWYHLYVDDVDEAFRVGTRLPVEAFAVAAVAGMQGLSVWQRPDRETGGSHFHFSPGLAALAQQHGASACALPSSKDLGGLLFGDPTAVPRVGDDT